MKFVTELRMGGRYKKKRKSGKSDRICRGNKKVQEEARTALKRTQE